MKKWLDSFFKISERGSTIKTEIVAGLTTFFAMAYIVVTNPNQVVGFNFVGPFDTVWNAVYIASILVAVAGTLLYAFYAKLPFAQACGMGLNSFFFVSFIVPEMIKPAGDVIQGYKEGLCIILLSGIIFLILSITGARSYIAKALPDCLKKAIPAGIGLFIAFIGFKNVGIVQANEYTLVQLFDFHGIISSVGMNIREMIAVEKSAGVIAAYTSFFNYDITRVATSMDAWRIIAPVIFALLGLFAIAVLDHKKVKGSVIITIGATTVLYYLATWQLPNFDLGKIGQTFADFGEIGLFGAFGGFGIFAGGATAIINAIVLTITFCLVDMFDTIGTLYGTAAQADMLDENGDPVDVDKAMQCDSVATVAGGLLGTSTCTTFVESAAGVAAGGRTGLTSLVTAACFFVCLFLSPVAAIVPACATAPALIYVGVLMLKNFAKVDMNDITSAVPAFLALIMMPLTYSISNGIAVGAIAYTLITLCKGKYTKKDIVVTVIAILFAIRFFLVTF
ncbi:MAG: NCS2 family permease [Clostridia bacterium]|nr:NCS2 family permease [Clostridia bacterium]